jgi:hypothetical protein
MTPRHLVPLDAAAVSRVCDDVLAEVPAEAVNVMLELVAFRDTRTPHDCRRLANALRYSINRDDLADAVLGLLDEPKSGVLHQLKEERSE